MQTKICAKCRDDKPTSEFYKLRISPDGFGSYCKRCYSEYRKSNEPVMDGQKVCIKCGEAKHVTEFYISRIHSDGRNSDCKDCRSKYQSSKNNKPATDGHKVCANCGESRHVEEFRVNRMLSDGRASYCKKCDSKYRRKNIEAKRAREQRRRSRKLKAPGQFTAKQFKKLCKQYDNRCVCCGQKGDLTVDHVVPLSKGGSNYIENIQPLCKSCNSSKATRRTDYRVNFHERFQLRLF